MILGFGHYSRTGKDTTVDYLVGFLHEFSPGDLHRKASFAYELKMICFELFKADGIQLPEYYDTEEGAKYRDVPLKCDKTPVQIWVEVGNKMREVKEEVWVDMVLGLQADNMGISDVRYHNEIDAIRAAGGKLVKVVRPGICPRVTVADLQLLGYDGWDYVIGGSGEKSDLRGWAQQFALAMLGHKPWPTQTPEDRAANLAVEAANIEANKEAILDGFQRLIEGAA